VDRRTRRRGEESWDKGSSTMTCGEQDKRIGETRRKLRRRGVCEKRNGLDPPLGWKALLLLPPHPPASQEITQRTNSNKQYISSQEGEYF